MTLLSRLEYWYRPLPDGHCRIDAPEVREAQRLAEIERCKHRDNDCTRDEHHIVTGGYCDWCLGFVEDITPKYLPQPQP